MQRIKALLLIHLVLMPVLWAQGNLQTLNGLLLDEISGKQISFATVLVSQTGQGVITNELGRFRMQVLPEDRLIIQVINYETLELEVPDSLLDQAQLCVIKLKPLHYELDEFSVDGEKKTPMALKSDVFQERPKVYEFFVSPISYVYYFLSKRERRKRQLVRMIEQEELMATFAHLYNRETIAQYAMLEGRDLDRCVIYCNANIELSRGDSDDDIKRKILLTLSDYFRTKAVN